MCYWCETRKACLMCGKPLPTQNEPSSCTVDSIVVPRVLWERTVKVVERVQNSRQGQMGALPLYCPSPMNRHGIDNLMNDIRRHNVGIDAQEKGQK